MRRPQLPLAARRTIAERPLSGGERLAWRLSGRIPPSSTRRSTVWPGQEATCPTPLPLRIVIRSFGEPDLITPLVRYCWSQGAERVVLLDDGSPDQSAELARGAGADVRDRPPAIEDRHARGLAWVMSVVEEDPTDAWWFSLDLDEFPVAPWGLTIAEFITLLPDDTDTVGVHALEHFPRPGGATSPEALIQGRAGAGARWIPTRYCPRAHFKHSLLRRRSGDPLRWGTSFHEVLPRDDGSRAREATVPLLMHHLRWRDLDEKRSHLIRMLADTRRSSPEKVRQLRNLEAVQRGRWDLHSDARPTSRKWGVELAPWQELARAWGLASSTPGVHLRAAAWGGSSAWLERIGRIAARRADLDLAIPTREREPDPAHFDIVFVPSPAAAAALNERFQRTTDAGIWVLPDEWSDEGLRRLLAGAVMDASASSAQRFGDPRRELRFLLQRLPRDLVSLVRRATSRRANAPGAEPKERA